MSNEQLNTNNKCFGIRVIPSFAPLFKASVKFEVNLLTSFDIIKNSNIG